MKMVKTIHIHLPNETSRITDNVAAILARRIEERSGVWVVNDSTGDFQVYLEVEQGVGPEGYTISDVPDGGIRITGNDERGLLYGVGKFLRTSQYCEGGFGPGKWRGSSKPDCPVRGIYFAVHFNNFYEAASDAEVERYLEDLALWGLNAVACHFPPQQFDGLDDPGAKHNIERIRSIFLAAKRIGLQVGLLETINIGFKSAPKQIYYTPFPDDLGRRGNLGTLLCPGNPEGRDYLLRQWGGLMDEFRDIELDFFESWPYDEGGCGCEKCWPWGEKGFLSISKEVADLFRSKYPSGRVILSTWMYDTPDAGEWDGLSKYMAEDGGWIDYIMADAHEDFPRYPLDNAVPGDRPLLNFPEISMWGILPWGGYGANPLPDRFQRLWNQAAHKLSGGFPYSEGISEDINKVLCFQFYWEKKRPAEDILKEYILFEASPNAADAVLEAVRILEANHHRDKIGESAVQACELMENVDKMLTVQARRAWRWRILFLRAQIDRELYRNGGEHRGPVLAKAFNELAEIYHAQNAFDVVRPPKAELV
ncbi:MAG: hypothetical protein ABFD64_10920 [Armatimonadota bacterium]